MTWSLRTLLLRRPPRGLVAERLRLLRVLRMGGGATALLIATLAISSLAPAALALATGQLVAGAEVSLAGGSASAAFPGLIALAVTLLVSQLAQASREGLSTEVRLRVDGWVRGEVRAAVAARVSLVDLADPDFQNDVNRASDLGQNWRVRSVGAAAVGQVALAARMAGGLAVAVVLAEFSVLIAVAVLVLSLLNRAVLRRQWMHLAGFDDGRASLRRRTAYWGDLATDPRAAGEVRLFGLGPWIAMRHRRAMVVEQEPVQRERTAVMRQQGIILVLTFTAAALGILPPALAAAQGDITTAALVTYLMATIGTLGLSSMGHEAFDIEYGRFTLRALDRMRASRPPATGGRIDRQVSDRGSLIELRDVGFRYPGQRVPVLREVNLTLRVGEVVGIVGPNGAGKTTLVKLLAGLFEPTSGAVAHPSSGPPRAAAVFQELVHYPLSLRDNIALSAPEAPATDHDVLAALHLAGGHDFLEKLPAGLDTVLQRDVTGGADLSGGQWQRVAIARAVFAVRAGRTLVILDEPTANLDVRAETAFYEKVVRALPTATIVLISHRLSTVRHADRIMLLTDGAISEEGSHDDLVRRDGTYARLFALQAARFRGDGQ
ncbi:ABC transporter ATP-binding protein [Occultella aeris]|uniref:Toxin RTX-I translocation ATP-binding protein n=1 Tax=Occultella aeris TaxID=2761496 RepID=A0A7M4DN88_9MICO|nr:ABC transporter ATP-binding protein [Occultella aeris]VZO38898.1 Toxin RTX-I translocation ATP-binding protein [Occultella aeris]